jgi:hypothetical protein
LIQTAHQRAARRLLHQRAAPEARLNQPKEVQMISMTLPLGDGLFWLLIIAGPVIGGLLYWKLGPAAQSAPVTAPIVPTPIVPDLLPVPTQRVGIPSTALVRIQDACDGHIKDGELDLRFELRSRRDCDKMLEVLRGMKEKLQRAKSLFNNATTEIRVQVDTGRTKVGGNAADSMQFVAAKNAELEGYETATRLVDKFLGELEGAEASVLELPFYTTPDPAVGP